MDSEKELKKYQHVITPEQMDAMQAANERATELLVKTVFDLPIGIILQDKDGKT